MCRMQIRCPAAERFKEENQALQRQKAFDYGNICSFDATSSSTTSVTDLPIGEYASEVFSSPWKYDDSSNYDAVVSSPSSSFKQPLPDNDTDSKDLVSSMTYIEEKHYEKAMNNGVFNKPHSTTGRKERKRSCNKEKHHKKNRKHFEVDLTFNAMYTSHKDITISKDEIVPSINSHLNDFIDIPAISLPSHSYSSHPTSIMAPSSRRRSCSDIETKKEKRHHKLSRQSRLRQQLSDGGIQLIDLTDDISLDEIYKIQNNFYSTHNTTFNPTSNIILVV